MGVICFGCVGFGFGGVFGEVVLFGCCWVNGFGSGVWDGLMRRVQGAVIRGKE